MIMISPKIRHNISRIIPISIIWLIFSLVYTLLERGILGELDRYPATGNPYNFTNNLFITPLTAWVAGLLIGTIEVLYLNRQFIKRTFTQKIIWKILIYFAIIVFFLLGVTTMANAIELEVALIDVSLWRNVWLFVSSFSFWDVVIFITCGMGVCLFYNEVSENLGPGVLNNFFKGKYHTPVVEERIFMFLDMKASTTIAERIGHVKYFEMLKEYFADLTDPIVNYAGEIYQYVGDEIVISWKVGEGIRMNNCIECFFAMKREIKKQDNKYLQRFGLVPDFKAGFHVGNVTTAEIGVIKKEIIFTGDVLNTTARIQSLCNNYKVDILISGQLLQLLNVSQLQNVKAIEEAELRGRDEKVMLYTLFPVTDL